jgi:hypothetical protein
MHGDQRDTIEAAGDEREEWVVPALTDLGSFQELTTVGAQGNTDAEGFS